MPSVTVLGQRRAVAELDATIARIEGQRREQLATLVRLDAAGKDTAQLRALLRLTEDYLACLRGSRDVLLWEPQVLPRGAAVAPAAARRQTGGPAGAAARRPRPAG